MYSQPNQAVQRNNPHILSLFGVQPQATFSKGMDIKENLKPDLTLKAEDPKKELGEDDEKDEDEDEKMLLDKACGDDVMSDKPEMFVPGANKK